MSRRFSRPAPRFTPEEMRLRLQGGGQAVPPELRQVLNLVRNGQLGKGLGLRFGVQKVPGQLLDGTDRALWFIYGLIERAGKREELLVLEIPPGPRVYASFRPAVTPEGRLTWTHVGAGTLEGGQDPEEFYRDYARRVLGAVNELRETTPPPAEPEATTEGGQQ